MATFAQLVQFGPYHSGGELVSTLHCFHYTAGTTTLLDVYTDRNKTTTAAQPVVSDANGIVSFYADGLFKFVIKDGSDSTILYTYDNWSVQDASGALSGEGASLTAASTLALGTDGNQFHVTGSTGITALSGTQTEVTLIFDSTPTLTHSGNLILVNGVNYTTIAGDVIKFMNEGSGVWRELTRWNDALASYAVPIRPDKAISGLTYDNGTDATNDININIGGARDATGAYWMYLATALGKQSDVAWAVGGTTGTPLGWLDTGTVGNSDYYIWLIGRSDTGVIDSLCSLSSTAPSMPTSYDYKRLIGWFKRVGGTIVAFDTYETEGGGLELLWDAVTTDISLASTLTTSRRTDAVKVPLNFSVEASLTVDIYDAAASVQAWVYCPDQSDQATGSPTANFDGLTTKRALGPLRVRTSATGTIAARANIATVDSYAVGTVGFRWARRN